MKNRFKIDKKTVLERSCDLLGAPGASRIDILMIFIDFWLHLGTLWGGSGTSWGSFLEALGPPGGSLGTSWGFLRASRGYWGALGKLFVIFLNIYPH